jgi:hypothetical protein
MKAEFTDRINSYISANPKKLPLFAGSEIGSVPFGRHQGELQESRYGDTLQSAHYRDLVLGGYIYLIRGDVVATWKGSHQSDKAFLDGNDMSVRQVCANDYEWGAELVISDGLGIDNKNGDLYKYLFKPFFWPRTVIRASWVIHGKVTVFTESNPR